MTVDSDEGRAAATVVIVREQPHGPPQFLMMERASTMAFAAGAPGGAVDPADHVLAARLDHCLPLDEAAARIAAIRETLEESGLGVGLAQAVDTESLVQIRRALAAGESLAAVLATRGIGLALEALVPFARWHPSPSERAIRVYDTRFYLARVSDGQVASVDATENVHLFWSSAAATIARCDAGDGRIIFPTRRNLERLAPFDSFDALVAHAAAFPVEKVRPWFEERDGERHLCIPDHLGYPVISEPVGTAARG
ncbi:MAG: NUDIX domain-containing protein [bacterium]|nr:NUDIX domain-containing protein [bacterium]